MLTHPRKISLYDVAVDVTRTTFLLFTQLSSNLCIYAVIAPYTGVRMILLVYSDMYTHTYVGYLSLFRGRRFHADRLHVAEVPLLYLLLAVL